MSKRGKKYTESASKLDRMKKYGFQEAVQLALDCAYTKMDETVDLAIRLGVDPRHADQMVRGSVVLPNGVCYLIDCENKACKEYVFLLLCA